MYFSGPQTFTRQEHEVVVSGPTQMILVPPRHFCKYFLFLAAQFAATLLLPYFTLFGLPVQPILLTFLKGIIQNPVIRDEKSNPIVAEDGSVQLRHGDEEVRIEVPEPFPLYPGEALYGKVSPLQVVAPNTALRLRAVRDFEDKNAGDEWLFKGTLFFVDLVVNSFKALEPTFLVLMFRSLKSSAPSSLSLTRLFAFVLVALYVLFLATSVLTLSDCYPQGR
jgi:major vault protein